MNTSSQLFLVIVLSLSSFILGCVRITEPNAAASTSSSAATSDATPHTTLSTRDGAANENDVARQPSDNATGEENESNSVESSKPVDANDGKEIQENEPQQAKARDWPNWMGPKYDGVSDETGWSTKWPRDGLPVRWSTKLGIGFSSIAIVDGKLFSMGHKDGVDTIYCLDADTGDLFWRVDDKAPLVDNLYEGGPGSTPTIDGEHVYYVTKGGRLQCLAVKDGARIWHVELQEDLDVELPEWGFNGSPYLLDDMLILEAGRVVAYDKQDGKKLWQTSRHTAGYGSATHFEQAGHTLVATLDCEGLRVVAAKNGRRVAFFPWKSPFRTNSTTPIIRDRRIYISSGYNVGCGMFELELPDDFSIEREYAADPGELHLVYSNRRMRNHFNNSIFHKGHFYGFDGNSNLGRVVHLTCMEASTGKVKWRQRGLGCGSLMIVDNRLLLLSEDGQLVVAEASAEGYTEISRAPILEGRCWTVPLLLNGRVYARNAAGTLVCVELPKSED